MKDGVMIINTGRGKLIHTHALIKGLKSKKIGAAGLDVYEEESDYFFEDRSNNVIDDDVLARLLSFNNVIVTSHQAFFTKEAIENIAETTLMNIQDFVEGKELVNEVTV
jgi:D-lactate dehydrogenase